MIFSPLSHSVFDEIVVMAKALFRSLRRASLLSDSIPHHSFSLGPEAAIFRPLKLIFPPNPTTPPWVSRHFSHGTVNLVISQGKPKFETHQIEPPKKEKWKNKKRFKLQKKREKDKRKAANRRDPRRLGLTRKPKRKFTNAEERIKYKLEKAKIKEALLVERLKRYEVSKVQGPVVKPHDLTDEIARLSGGIPVQIIGDDTIVFYRGKNYVMPELMSPVDTLSKKRALEKSKYEQSLESVRHFIAIAEKELELYYRHIALYGDLNNRNPISILDSPTKSNREIKEPQMLERDSHDLTPTGFSSSISDTKDDDPIYEELSETEDDSKGDNLSMRGSDSEYEVSYLDEESEGSSSGLHKSDNRKLKMTQKVTTYR
ncbi:Far-red impaired responsive family protein [Hibiscus syriacus]|uniref:Far-red impaired responsive family protein n=1 Tax=Hibiscus syriacus TaxID=106335 RepID=A0A6A3CL26_HIBSY|nr:Far-red impaired responsive family protein [Hibiscus syriacus]